jgi:stringent starvation protein B
LGVGSAKSYRMAEGTLPPKREVACTLLRKGSLFVHLDPRVSGVRVPAWLSHQPQLVLQVGFEMLIPIPDLRVDDEGVLGTLSFSRMPFTCFVPWDAVFALVGDDGRGMVWPESMPAEIAAEVDREAARAKRSGDVVRPTRARGESDKREGLRAVHDSGDAGDAGASSTLWHELHDGKAELERDTDKMSAPNFRADARARAVEGARESSDARGAARPARGAQAGPSRARRSLPPYLRVVK